MESAEVSQVAQSIEDIGFCSLSAEANVHSGMLAYYHGGRGHFKVGTTLEMIEREGNTWPGYVQHVKDFVNSCKFCEANEPKRVHYHNNSFSIVGEAPGQAWSVDTIELDNDSQNYKYALTIIDNFSRWLSIFPLRTLESEEALQWIWHSAMMEGAPDIIIYDSGRTFNNKLFDKINTFLGVNGIKTAPGSHEENGLVESVNAEVRLQLRKLTQAATTPNDWSWYCPIVARNHNSRPNQSTGTCPSDIRFGRWNRAGPESSRSHEDTLQFAEEHLLDRARKKAEKAKKTYSGEHDPAELQPGRWVWRMNSRESKRLLNSTPWLGPFLIQGRAGNSLELQIPGRPNEITNISAVKLAVGM